jgi:hypothetical protein
MRFCNMIGESGQLTFRPYAPNTGSAIMSKDGLEFAPKAESLQVCCLGYISACYGF